MDPKSLKSKIAHAISDPGHYTPRGQDYQEPITCWGARAVAIMLINEYAPNAPLLHTQDNRITAEPMFCVQCLEREYGYDPSWTDDAVWLYDGEEVAHDVAGAYRTGYKDRWRTVMVSFTEEGAKEHLRLNGHNYGGESKTRIYVESFRRNPEMMDLRKLLMELATIAQP